MSATDLDTAPTRATPAPVPVPTLGHVHLKVANLDRALGFYRDLLGFEVMERMGADAAFLATDGYHHHLALNTWESKDASPPPPGHTGLFHAAFLYKDRADLGAVVKRVLDAGYRLDGASDHGVSEAVYLRDPDGNGVELYRDRPRADWPRRSDGSLKMTSQRLDLAALLAEAHPEQS
ncbi:VOC family protein [Dinoroseobacter sp. S76]|uniref:VOC family protein n=1 Tax=Dinoroseobacter sp. S76 TaxID=3415124 RepID=UPI003C7BB9BA